MKWHVANSLNVLRDEINMVAPDRSKAADGAIGDAAHSSRLSDHNPCPCHSAVCARDITHDPGGGFDSYAFADWLRERCRHGQEDRVKYIISNSRIASPSKAWAWRSYSGANPHDHHVHVSVAHGPEYFESTEPWGWFVQPPPPTPIGDDDMAAPANIIDADGNGWVFFRGRDGALWYTYAAQGARSLGGQVTDRISAATGGDVVNIHAYAPDGDVYMWQFRGANLTVDKALVQP